MQVPFLRLIAALVVAAAGCASMPPPTESLAEAMASVQTAEQIGAAKQPQAALSLQRARDEVDRTRALMADKKHHRAALMAERAASDAELAIALFHENQAAMEAQRAEASAAGARPNP